MIEKNSITDKYYHILELLNTSPGDEEALTALIDLEESIKSYLFDILQSKHGSDFQQSHVFSKFSKGNTHRDVLECLVMHKITGNKISISDITDLFIKKITSILSLSVNNEEKIKLLNIQYIKILETILPPDYERTLILGSGAGWIEKGKDFDKFSLLIQLLREKGVYTDDILAIEGENKANMMRKDSYIVLYIPRLNKTVFVNNNYGEATFIYNGSMDVQFFTSLGKAGLQPDLQKIIFSEKHIGQRRQEVYEALFIGDNAQKKDVGVKIDIKAIKNNMIKKQEFLDFYNILSPEDKKIIVSGHSHYIKRAKQYPQIPKSYGGLISLLGGNKECMPGGYIEALIAGTGDDYFEKWKKNNEKTNEQKKQEFLEFYNTLSSEDKKEIVTSSVTYNKRAKKYPQFPQYYEGLIFLLGGKKKGKICLKGGYVEALIVGIGDEYFEKWKKDNTKPKEQKRQEFLKFYNTLYSEDKKIVVGGGEYYKLRAKQYPNIPKTYQGLATLLGGNKKCTKGDYIESLIVGTGEEYFEKWKQNSEKSVEQRKQAFLAFYNNLSPNDKTIIVKSGLEYINRAKKYPQIPQSYLGLIVLLGGNTKCGAGGYVEALIVGTGEEYFEKWKQNSEKSVEQRKQAFLEFYNQLSPEDKKIILSNATSYSKRAKQYPNIPKTYQGLISLLGGNKKCGQGGYVEALLKSPLEGKKYFKDREKARIHM